MSATESTRRTPLRRAKSSRDAGVSPGRDGMLFAESVVTLTSASRLLQSLALYSLARTRRHHVGSMVQTDSAVARSRRLVGYTSREAAGWWAIQYLHLSSVPGGLTRRDDPFGSLKLANDPQ